MEGTESGIAQWMACYDVREAHAVRVAADSDRVYEAAKQLLPSEVPLLRILFALRSLPARLSGGPIMRFPASVPLIDQMLSLGFVLLEERPGEEIILGVIGQFWRPSSGLGFRPTTADTFRRFNQPGCARAVLSLRIQRLGDRACLLSTETRVEATDDVSRLKLRLYWLVIGAGSALIRRMWLRAVKRRAEGS